jgi:MFS family permease
MTQAVKARPNQFWIYWTASTTSLVGTSIKNVALPLTAVLVLGATELATGLLTAAGYVAWLVIGLPAGPIVRRLPLRRVQVSMDTVRALAVLSIPAAWWLGWLTLTQLIVVALVISFADVLFFVANSTFLPRIVPPDQLLARNSLIGGTQAACQLGGPSLGGLLVQYLGAAPTLIFDAVSYLVSALLLRSLPEPEQQANQPRESMRRQIREGWDFVVRHPVMRPCLWSATAANFVSGGQLALVAIYLVRDIDAPIPLVGVLLASTGVGTLIGAALSPWGVRILGSARVCIVAAALFTVGSFLMPLGTGTAAFALFALGSIVLGIGVVVLSTAIRTYRQIATPPDLLSRVAATVRFVSWGVTPVGAVLAGVLGSWLGARGALLAFAVLTALVPATLVFSAVRRLRDFPTTAEESSPAAGEQKDR